ncbi:MAG TPA: magnesium transporter CorA family protein [Bacteroidales bacterium]|nr:magnesium transporter CorA family protein [Bacteroidales bacterium]
MNTISFYHILTHGELASLNSLDQALDAMHRGGYVWFDCCRASREDLYQLAEPLGLSPLTIEDCSDQNQVPKIEDFDNYSFVIFNYLRYSNSELISDEVDIITGKNFIVTVSAFAENSTAPLSGLEGLVRKNLLTIKSGPAYLMHLVLDNIVDNMAAPIESMEEEVDLAEEAILDSPADFDAAKLIYLRRNLLALRKSLFHEREILLKIIRNDCSFIPEKITMHFRDIYDHISNFFEMTESNRDNVTGLMELYASMLNNKMARDSNQTNASVRRLTLITTIFMPLTLIAGVFGMSEWTMMTGADRWRISYLIFFATLAVIGAASYMLLKWLERRD